MPSVAKGVMTFGLGGNATNMIVSSFGLGPLSVVVEVPKPPSGGYAGAFVPIKRKKHYQTVFVTVYYKDKTWKRKFKFRITNAQVFIWVTSMVAKVTNGINISVSSIKKLINKIRIRR